jgi:DNA-binding NarL/FixJ family response regulator
MIGVLVADDQVPLRAGLVATIRAADGLEVVGEAADGPTAVALAARTRPQVVLIDAGMWSRAGVTATERILANSPGPPPRVLVLTAFDLDVHGYAVLPSGASGFLLKDTPPERLVIAIRAVAAGDLLLAPSVTRRPIDACTPPPRAGHPYPELRALTAREVEVLRIVGTGRSNADIAAALFVSEATVKTHVNRLMAKLDLTSRAQAVVAAYESGLVVPRRPS